MALQKKQLPRTVVPEIHDAADGMGCRKNAMRVRETSGIQWGVGKCARAPRSIYIYFILLRMYVCQYDAWKGTLVYYTKSKRITSRASLISIWDTWHPM